MKSEPVRDIPRRVSTPVQLPALVQCPVSGIQPGPGDRVIVVSGDHKAGSALVELLENRGVMARHIAAQSPEQMAAEAEAFAAEGVVRGLYFLLGLEPEPPFTGSAGNDWLETLRLRVEGLFVVMKSLPGQPFLVCATRTDSTTGSDAPASGVMGSAIAGFSKALAQERPGVLIKMVGFEPGSGPARVARILLDETLADPASVEVAYQEGKRFKRTLREQPVEMGGFQPDSNTVYLVSGGTGGIVIRCLEELAKAHGGRFYLLGRRDLPVRIDQDVLELRSDRAAFQREIARRMKEGGEKATPVAVETRIAQIERGAAARAFIQQARERGVTVDMLAGDIRDPAACEVAVRAVLEREGRIDVFIHAAGVEFSRKLENKPLEELRQTMAVKVEGFSNLFSAMQKNGAQPRSVVFFSTLAARFGLSGQTDYAAANATLDRLSHVLPVTCPGMRVESIQWGPWAEVGMASRGSAPEWMCRAGIGLLNPHAAAQIFVRELSAAGNGEVLLAGSLGRLPGYQRDTNPPVPIDIE